MSKVVKDLIIREYETRLDGVQDATLISIRGIDAMSTNSIRRKLAKQQIEVVVVRNSLARKAFEGTGLEPMSRLLAGASALAYGAESVVEVARAIVDLLKDYPGIELKGAVLDGKVFEGDAGVRELSKYPTRDEAIAEAVTLILSPGRKLVGSILGPGSRVAGVVKSIQDKLEAGETIQKVG
jgi:large subunit ribosomal protein L10